jgi:hypothetical protein
MFLSDAVQIELRRLNRINENEVLKKEGDLFIAINVVNQQRRIIQLEMDLVEKINKMAPSSGLHRKILKG